MDLEKALGLFIVIMALAMLLVVMSAWVHTPVVQFSWSEGYCIKVINFAEGDNYSCENMPEKYESEWVK